MESGKTKPGTIEKEHDATIRNSRAYQWTTFARAYNELTGANIDHLTMRKLMDDMGEIERHELKALLGYR